MKESPEGGDRRSDCWSRVGRREKSREDVGASELFGGDPIVTIDIEAVEDLPQLVLVGAWRQR